jgi:hypothetical protein
MAAVRPGILFACIISIGCSGGFAVGCGTDGPPHGTAVDAQPAMAHGDHSPHHGGVVMMKGDLHYELVLDPSGRYRLYFSDAMRQDLPASTAVRASLTIARKGAAPEGVELQIDESGESWVGQGQPVADPAATTARVAYTLRGEEPYWIDLPFDTKPTRTEAHQ